MHCCKLCKQLCNSANVTDVNLISSMLLLAHYIDGRFVCRQLTMVLFWTQNSADSTTNRRTGLKRSWSRSHCSKSLPIHQVSSRSLYVSQNLLYIDWLWQCRLHCWTARSHLPTIVMRRFFIENWQLWCLLLISRFCHDCIFWQLSHIQYSMCKQ